MDLDLSSLLLLLMASCVTLVLEPGRFRSGRDPIETASTAPDHMVRGLFPAGLPRILLTHTRPEPMTGLLRRIDEGPGRLRALGLEVAHESADAAWSFCRDGSVSWLHLLRFMPPAKRNSWLLPGVCYQICSGANTNLPRRLDSILLGGILCMISNAANSLS